MALAINPRQTETTHGVISCGELPLSTCKRIIDEHKSQKNLCVTGRVADKNKYKRDKQIRDVTSYVINEETIWLDEIILSLAETALAYLTYDVVGLLERPQLLHYKENSNGYNWHTDIGTGVASTRKISISVNLNDQYEGGSFEFFSDKTYKFSVPQGQAIDFPSFLSHRVTPITKGERWALVAWIGGQPFR